MNAQRSLFPLPAPPTTFETVWRVLATMLETVQSDPHAALAGIETALDALCGSDPHYVRVGPGERMSQRGVVEFVLARLALDDFEGTQAVVHGTMSAPEAGLLLRRKVENATRVLLDILTATDK